MKLMQMNLNEVVDEDGRVVVLEHQNIYEDAHLMGIVLDGFCNSLVKTVPIGLR